MLECSDLHITAELEEYNATNVDRFINMDVMVRHMAKR